LPDKAKPAFRFWSFFFSLKGRVSRVPIWAFVLPVKAVLQLASFALLFYEHEVRRSFLRTAPSSGSAPAIFNHYQDLRIVGLVFGLIAWLMFWPIFALLFKRLHDAGWLGLFALPVPLSFVYIIAMAIFRILHHNTMPDPNLALYTSWILGAIKVYGWTLAIILAVLPGMHGTNRFGPAPGQPPATAEDVF